jgi:hypothetical protein
VGDAAKGNQRNSFIIDTPKATLFDYQTYRWRRDKFWCYLMWQPKRRPFVHPCSAQAGTLELAWRDWKDK